MSSELTSAELTAAVLTDPLAGAGPARADGASAAGSNGAAPAGSNGAAPAGLDAAALAGLDGAGPAGLDGAGPAGLDGAGPAALDGAAPADDTVGPRRLDEAGHELAVQFAAVARALESEATVEATLRRVVDVAVAIVPGCHHAGLTVVRGGRPETPAASDGVSGEVDKVQYETGEGPCLSAIVEHHTFRTGDLASERRWPKFSGPAVERTGVHSVLAYRLFTSDDTLGALNLYSRDKHAFDADAIAVGSILAAHAALAFARAKEREQISGLEQAVASNRAIGMAIGILMGIHRVSEAEAFDLLRIRSQRANRKLRDIAQDVVLTGELPDERA